MEQFRLHDGRSLGELEQQREPDAALGAGRPCRRFPLDGGATIKYGKSQIAVFNFASRGEWYATQNMCPHKKAFVLSRGIVGTAGDEPKVACPLHKKTFSLETGESLQGEEYRIQTFPVKVEGGQGLCSSCRRRSARSHHGDGNRLQLATHLQRSCEWSGGMQCRRRVRCPA